MHCTRCGAELSAETVICPVCGEPVNMPRQQDDLRQPIQQAAPQQGYPQGQAGPRQEYPRQEYPQGQAGPRQEYSQQGYPQPQGNPKVSDRVEEIRKYVKSFAGIVRWYSVSLVKPGQLPALSNANGFEWIPILVLNLFLFAIVLAANVSQTVDKVNDSLSSTLFGGVSLSVSFGKMFGCNLLIALVYYLFMYGLTFADVKFLRKSGAPFNTIMNNITVAAYPMFGVLLLNLIGGIIGIFVPVILFSTAFIALQTVRANMMKRLCAMKDLPVVDAAVINGVTLMAAGLILYGLYHSLFENAFTANGILSYLL